MNITDNGMGVRIDFIDGTFEEGDVVIGCDGAHSIVRDAMWEMASKVSSDLIPESEKNCKPTLQSLR